MTKRKFSEGDRVLVISECASKGRKGTVRRYEPNFWTGCVGVSVSLDNGVQLTYNEHSLKKIGESKTKEDNMAINEVQGNYRIAMVRHCEGNANRQSNGKVYAFALFDDDVVIGDKVLCNSECGYSVADVIDINTKQEYSQAHSRVVTKEIICRVDFSNFDKRAADRKERAAIKAEMDKLVAENQDLILYRAIAENNPAMAELLERYTKLNEVEKNI